MKLEVGQRYISEFSSFTITSTDNDRYAIEFDTMGLQGSKYWYNEERLKSIINEGFRLDKSREFMSDLNNIYKE